MKKVVRAASTRLWTYEFPTTNISTIYDHSLAPMQQLFNYCKSSFRYIHFLVGFYYHVAAKILLV